MKTYLTSLILVFYLNIKAQVHLDNSVFAVVKFSYNEPGEMLVTGGICGTGFLINDSTVLLANHILNRSNFIPNPGYKFVQFWLLKRGTKLIIPLSADYLQSMEDIESTVVRLPEIVKCDLLISQDKAKPDEVVQSFGHLNSMPVTDAHWENDTLVIDGYNLEKSKSDASGRIVEIRNISINATDVKLTDVKVIQPSFKGNRGMSGGPLISNQKVIGMMSFGFPADLEIKDTVFAIAIDQIITRLK
ncbi:hypothetical protein [Flavobacterium crocinum]|uniref:hypothetical protein n=1 Tax=Flavobacterium crocinum TaxID=2183896 RepID=UPI0011B248D5|nr:hypothetical protein [Flavobacterium crocinum]